MGVMVGVFVRLSRNVNAVALTTNFTVIMVHWPFWVWRGIELVKMPDAVDSQIELVEFFSELADQADREVQWLPSWPNGAVGGLILAITIELSILA